MNNSVGTVTITVEEHDRLRKEIETLKDGIKKKLYLVPDLYYAGNELTYHLVSKDEAFKLVGDIIVRLAQSATSSDERYRDALREAQSLRSELNTAKEKLKQYEPKDKK